MAPVDELNEPLLATEAPDPEAGGRPHNVAGSQASPPQQQQQSWMPSVSMPEDLGPGLAAMAWERPPDAERWICSFYTYFENGGCRGVLSSNAFHVAGMTFMMIFFFIVVFMINWTDVMLCTSEESCQDLYFVYRNLSTAFAPHRIGFLKIFMCYCFLLFTLYWFFSLGNAVHAMRDGFEMQRYYKEKLGIVDDAVLSTMSWSEVVSKLVAQQKREPIIVTQSELTALEIANIIMREDNFMLALTNHNVLTKNMSHRILERLVYTRAMQFCLRYVIFRTAFNTKRRIQPEFLTDVEKLKSNMRGLGAVSFVVMSAVGALVAMLFVLRHTEEFRSHKGTPVRRGFNDFAKWHFREYSELKHLFKERMRSAQLVAEEYTQCSRPPAPVIESIGRFLKFVAGSLLAVLVVIAFMDDTPLFFVKFVDRNLLWYLALFGMLYTLMDNLLSESQHPAAPSLPVGSPLLSHSEMMRLARCTHYYPPSWRPQHSLLLLAGLRGGPREELGGPSDRGVSVGEVRAKCCKQFSAIRGEFLENFFLTRIQALLEELLGVFAAPFILYFHLPHRAEDILDLMRRTRYETEGLGDFCVYGFLDPSVGASGFYQRHSGPVHQRADAAASASSERFARSGLEPQNLDITRVPPSRWGKLEKSAINFILAHRTPWYSDETEDLRWEPTQEVHIRQTESQQQHQQQQGQPPPHHLQLEMVTSFRRAPQAAQAGGLSDPGSTIPDLLTGGTGTSSMGIESNEDNEDDNGSSNMNFASGPSADPVVQQPQFQGQGHRQPESGQPAAGEVLGAEEDEEEDVPQWTHTVPQPQPPRPAVTPPTPSQADGLRTVPIWGYPHSALRLLRDIEDFQRAECGNSHWQRRLYSLYPPELLNLERTMSDGRVEPGPLLMTPTLGPFGSTRAGPLDGHAGRVGCSGHFFWLEIFRDFNAGTHENQLRDVGDQSRFTFGAGQDTRVDIAVEHLFW